ncbi:MAG: BlaI/MecI/CopY family transcriptional regulator [Gammaproteobacteria bacterium]|nr:BlaI/MecI/CopY family transcriptional regulator [Gammaproteobacteria bacterium]
MTDSHLTPKERQIMDLLYARAKMSVGQVNDALGDGSSYSSTRASLTRLVEKNQVRHQRDGVRYLFSPAMDAHSASKKAIGRVMDIFFGGSPSATVDAVLKFSGDTLSSHELEQIQKLIKQARGKRGSRQ